MGMTRKRFTVRKMSGEKQDYNRRKLWNSLKKSGADDQTIDLVISEIEAILYEDISTKEIYKKAFSLLKLHSRPNAGRYKLKRAIMELGPSGFPFEKFVGAILTQEGFKTKISVTIEGKCVNHEIDVIAQKAGENFMIECKFHNEQSRHSDVKVPLYIHSRFQDVEFDFSRNQGQQRNFKEGWIITNTRFTNHALQYGTCVGLKMIAWDFPAAGSLKELIDRSGLHPITCLTTLTKIEKQNLLESGIVLCKELCETPAVLGSIGVKSRREEKVLAEAFDLCTLT